MAPSTRTCPEMWLSATRIARVSMQSSARHSMLKRTTIAVRFEKWFCKRFGMFGPNTAGRGVRWRSGRKLWRVNSWLAESQALSALRNCYGKGHTVRQDPGPLEGENRKHFSRGQVSTMPGASYGLGPMAYVWPTRSLFLNTGLCHVPVTAPSWHMLATSLPDHCQWWPWAPFTKCMKVKTHLDVESLWCSASVSHSCLTY